VARGHARDLSVADKPAANNAVEPVLDPARTSTFERIVAHGTVWAK